MYNVSIYDKNKRLVAEYEDIHTINYTDDLIESISISGNELLTHKFPTAYNYQLLSDTGNYSIDKSIIGTFEVVKTF